MHEFDLSDKAGGGAERRALKQELEESLSAIRSELTAIPAGAERHDGLSLLDNALSKGLKHLGRGRKPA
ncbi:MAG: hypothetical protein ACRBC3_08080 [Burkholderiaceae bacterium]